MIFRLGNLRQLAPLALHRIIRIRIAKRHALIRNIRNSQQCIANSFLGSFHLRVHSVNLITQLTHFFHNRGSVLTIFFQHANFLGNRIALRFHLLNLGQNFLAAGLGLQKRLQIDLHITFF